MEKTDSIGKEATFLKSQNQPWTEQGLEHIFQIMHAVQDPDCLVSGYLTIIAHAPLQLHSIWMKR